MFQKLYHHLEEINANTRQHQTSLEQSEAWTGKISQQLEELNTSVLSLRDKPPRSGRGSRVAAFVLAGVGLVLLGMLWANTQRLAVGAEVGQKDARASMAAYRVVDGRTEEVAERSADLEVRTGRLDSLVVQQAQAIEELKKLNVSAMRTVNYLRQELYRQRRQEAVQALVR